MNQADGWHAGVARVDITPPIGVWLCGFGSRKRPAEGVHDPLYATAAVFERAGQKVAVVSCDVLSIDAVDVARVRGQISEATGIPASHIMIHATHTHAGPVTSSMRGFGPRDREYESVFFRQIVTAVILANQRLQPVRLTFGTAEAPIGINRRENRNGQIIIGENPDGPIDRRAAVLAVWPAGDESGTAREPVGAAPSKVGSGATTDAHPEYPIALLLWSAVHPVMLGGGNYLFGRDFPHYALERLETALPGCICLYLTGPCGDTNPLGMATPDPFAMAKRHGEVLAGSALQALATSRPVEGERIGAVQHVVDVPYEPLSPLKEVRASLEKWEAEVPPSPDGDEGVRRTTDHRLHWADDALAALEGHDENTPLPQSIPAELHLLFLGDVALVGMPFEVFTEYQYVVNEAAKGYDALIVGYANGNFGYLPTRPAFDEGGYEVDRAWWYYTLTPLSQEAPDVVEEGLRTLHAKANSLGSL